MAETATRTRWPMPSRDPEAVYYILVHDLAEGLERNLVEALEIVAEYGRTLNDLTRDVESVIAERHGPFFTPVGKS